MAAIAGPRMQLAAACSARAPKTTGKIGHTAMASALTQIATTATPMAMRAERTASTSAPPGIWPANEIRPPAVRMRPMSICVHDCVVK